MAARVAKSGRAQRRGRWLVATIIATALAVMLSIVWRRTVGTAAARDLQQLSTRLSELQAQRTQLASDIFSQSSLTRIGSQVQSRLGMRMPSESQVIYLPVPRPPASPRRGRSKGDTP